MSQYNSVIPGCCGLRSGSFLPPLRLTKVKVEEKRRGAFDSG